MSKSFREWSLDQALLLPPSVHDFVPAGHLSRFVVALVTEELNLSASQDRGPSATLRSKPDLRRKFVNWCQKVVLHRSDYACVALRVRGVSSDERPHTREASFRCCVCP
jgi:hypothetical protein